MTELSWQPDELTLRAELATSAPRVPWDVFLRDHFKPRPGQHIAIIGPNGAGKTNVQNNILPLFPFVTVFATKPLDDTMDRLIATQGYVKLPRWYGLNPREVPRRVLWPDATRLDSRAKQTTVFRHAMERIFAEAGKKSPIDTVWADKGKPVGWMTAMDELWYVVNRLGLKDEVEQFLFQGRSLGHSLCLATQRPFYVPPSVYDQAMHLFFFRIDEYRALQRLGEIQSSNRKLVRHAVANLDSWQVLYVHNVPHGKMLRTRTPPPI